MEAAVHGRGCAVLCVVLLELQSVRVHPPLRSWAGPRGLLLLCHGHWVSLGATVSSATVNLGEQHLFTCFQIWGARPQWACCFMWSFQLYFLRTLVVCHSSSAICLLTSSL